MNYVYLPHRRRLEKIKARKRRAAVIKITAVFLFGLFLGLWLANNRVTLRWPVAVEPKPVKMLSPIPEETPTPTPKSAPRGELLIKPVLAKEPEPTPAPEAIEGEASYYSREGCLGCGENMIMANGQPLDDTMRTLALTPEVVSSGKRLNDMVTVINTKNGKQTRARVTDTGGFGRLGRVADLSVATKNAIGCGGVCQVKVVFD